MVFCLCSCWFELEAVVSSTVCVVVLSLLGSLCLKHVNRLLFGVSRSEILHCSVLQAISSMKCEWISLAPLISGTMFISMKILRWSNDEMYLSDGIQQNSDKEYIALEKNTKSVRCDPRMNVLVSLSIPWWWAIGSIILYFKHNLRTFPLLLVNIPFTSIPSMILCFLLIRSLIKRIKWISIKDAIDSVLSDSLLSFFYCWADLRVHYTSYRPNECYNSTFVSLNSKVRPSSKVMTVFSTF